MVVNSVLVSGYPDYNILHTVMFSKLDAILIQLKSAPSKLMMSLNTVTYRIAGNF